MSARTDCLYKHCQQYVKNDDVTIDDQGIVYIKTINLLLVRAEHRKTCLPDLYRVGERGVESVLGKTMIESCMMTRRVYHGRRGEGGWWGPA